MNWLRRSPHFGRRPAALVASCSRAESRFSNSTKACRARGFWMAVETNGTRPIPMGAVLDWVCVSPKAGAALVLKEADELKLVYPQRGLAPESFAEFSATHRWLSPMDAPRRTARNIRAAAAY